MGCREFLGCCGSVPCLADWILGYYWGSKTFKMQQQWSVEWKSNTNCRCCLPRLLPGIQLWSLPSDILLQVSNILDIIIKQLNMEHICPDKKNGFRNFVMSVMVKWGVHNRGDPLDPDGLKAKLVFGITQFIYTLITISPVSIRWFMIRTVILHFHPFSLTRLSFSSPPMLSPAAGWSWLTVGEPGTEPAITLR